MARKKPQLKRKRFKVDGHDPETGELLVPIVFLWLTKDGSMKANNVGGALKSGTEVEVIRREPDWYYVACDIHFRGKTFHQQGYIRDTLIKEYKTNG